MVRLKTYNTHRITVRDFLMKSRTSKNYHNTLNTNTMVGGKDRNSYLKVVSQKILIIRYETSLPKQSSYFPMINVNK